MKIKTLIVGPIGTNCYLLCDEDAKTCAVVDPGGDAGRVAAAVAGAIAGESDPAIPMGGAALKGVEDISICRLTESDVVRHVLVQRIIKAYEEDEERRGPKKDRRERP